VEEAVTGGARFCLLGTLQISVGERVLSSLPAKQRVLLAALLLSANRQVTLDRLAAAAWDSRPPASAHATIRNYVKELRKVLASTGYQPIRTEPGGYLISVGPGELDILRFEQLCGEAQEAAGRSQWAAAMPLLDEALSLWRGEPLTGIPSEQLALTEVPRLTELRSQVAELRIDAGLRLGRHAGLFGDLAAEIARYPMRESLRALQMLALYRAGRQAEALAVYRQVRELLVEELGTEPGPDLAALHQRVLAGDPALTRPPQTEQHQPAAPVPSAAVVPRQLPPAVSHFTGRSGELAALSDMLTRPGGAGRTVVISALAGTAGVGKTTTAIFWAHQVASHFPDGQLYVNLRGFDPGEPASAATVLAGFVHALSGGGVPVPATVDDRAALFRSLAAGRRLLVVLDNAASAEQVRPLLPGSADCAVLVTSRNTLSGLVAVDGARRLELDVLSPGSAAELLRALIGERAEEDPAAAAALAAYCGWLPLALRIGAELVVARPGVALATLAAELADQNRRLDLLQADDDPRASVQSVFSWSCRHLDPSPGRLFRLLGLHDGPDFTAAAAAALAGIPGPETRALLDLLVGAHLVQPAHNGRYAMHDLLKAYARQQAGDLADQAPATRRLLTWYLHSASNAARTLSGAGIRDLRLAELSAETEAEEFGGDDAGRAWLEAERANLVAVVFQAAATGHHVVTWQLTLTLFDLFQLGGHVSDWIATAERGLASASELGDSAARGKLLHHLGSAYLVAGRGEEAVACLREATEFSSAPLAARLNLGLALIKLKRLDEAAVPLGIALAGFRETGYRLGEGVALAAFGAVALASGRLREALGAFCRSLRLAREHDLAVLESDSLTHLTLTLVQLRRPEAATAAGTAAVACARRIGHRYNEAQALEARGQALRIAGRPDETRSAWVEAMDILTQLGRPAQAAEIAGQLDELGNAQPVPAAT
jgi:DNA-binding SARP family transcriptional activator/tetratricopeptide (TPR) repeat protein